MPIYNNPYLNNYGGYYPNYPQQPNYSNNSGFQPQVVQSNNATNAPMMSSNYMQLTFVNGLDEANKYIVAPNTSIYLRDNNSNKLYIKSCDSTGRTTLEEYNLIKPEETSKNSQNLAQNIDTSVFVSRDDLSALETKFEAKLSKLQSKIDKLQVKKIIEE